MITFTRVPTVAQDQPVTSKHARALALAANDRGDSGIGGFAWRVFHWFLGLGRNPRIGDGTNFPAMGEWLSYWMLLEPASGRDWPAAAPGEPEGANPASPLPAFKYGQPGNASPEDQRLDNADYPDTSPVLMDIGGHPPSPAEWFTLGRIQAGIITADRAHSNTPALTAAREHRKLGFSLPYAKNYGGFPPVPLKSTELSDDGMCNNANDDPPEPDTPNYLFFFTPLRPELPLKSYPGSCPDTHTPGHDLSGHVRFIARSAEYYYVVLNNGSVEALSRYDYIEGPYRGGGELRKLDGETINRTLHYYLKAYRGTAEERAAVNGRVWETGFDFQRFIKSQYLLSPNLGHLDGDGNLQADFPTFNFNFGDALLPAGTVAASEGGPTHTWTTGFVLGGFLIASHFLVGSASIELIDDNGVFWSGSIRGDSDDATHGSLLVFFEGADVRTRANVFARLTAPAVFSDGTHAVLTITCTEQLAFKPFQEDCYMVERLLSTTGGASFEGTVDGPGETTSLPKRFSDSYFTYGALANPTGALGLPAQSGDILTNPAAGMLSNPVVDAGRRMAKDSVRLATREQLIGYEVISEDTGGGSLQQKSVLHFHRKAFAPGSSVTDPAADTFDGIADQIRHTAGERAYTNEWWIWVEFMAYRDSGSSLFKPSVYADYFPLNNRCLSGSNEISPDQNWDAFRHFAFGAKRGLLGDATSPFGLLFAEAPPEYNYVNGVNSRYSHPPGESPDANDALSKFQFSCRLMEPPMSVERAESYTNGDGIECVKLVLTERLHHSDADGTADIPLDTTGWDAGALGDPNQPRTAENGIRSYLLHIARGLNFESPKIGDHAATSDIALQSGTPWASIYPRFPMLKKVEIPFDDSNDVPEPADTTSECDPILRSELYAAAGCTGYIDGQASTLCGDRDPLLYDFTPESICFQAFGMPFLSLLPTADRPDKPLGYGPLPVTPRDAERFNHLGAVYNLMTKARLMLPFYMDCRSITRTNTVSLAVDIQDGSLNRAIKYNYQPTLGGAPENGDWSHCGGVGEGGLSASAIGYFNTQPPVGAADGHIDFVTIVQGAVMRLDGTVAANPNVLPPKIRDMVETDGSSIGNVGLLFRKLTTESHDTISPASSAAESPACCHVFVDPDACGTRLAWDTTAYKAQATSESTSECILLKSGHPIGLTDPPPRGDFWWLHNTAESVMCGGSSGRSISLILGSANTLFLEVPLIDLP